MTKTVFYVVIALITVSVGIGGYVIFRDTTELHVEKKVPMESRTEAIRHGDKFSDRFQPKLPD